MLKNEERSFGFIKYEINIRGKKCFSFKKLMMHFVEAHVIPSSVETSLLEFKNSGICRKLDFVFK